MWVAALTATALMAPFNADAYSPKTAQLVIDANTGAVLYERSADEHRYPASLTKMMTLYLVFETLETGRISMNSRITMSRHADAAPPSKLPIRVGGKIKVSDAIRALITKSANNVARAVAEFVGGSEANFVRLMNQRARQMGMKKTVFRNPSGLPDRRQVTTARDMITLAMRLQDDYPEYYKLFRTRYFSYRGRNYRNHNRLLSTFQGVDGIKTGYTRASGFNLVSSVRRSRRHVVAAVFGGKSGARRNALMRNLLARALPRASTRKTRRPSPLVAKLKRAPKRIASARLAADTKPMTLPRRKPEKAAPVARQAFARPRLATTTQAAKRPAKAAVRTSAPNTSAPDQRHAGTPPIHLYKVKRVAIKKNRPAAPAFSIQQAAKSVQTASLVTPEIANSVDPIAALAVAHERESERDTPNFAKAAAFNSARTSTGRGETVVPKRPRRPSAASPSRQRPGYPAAGSLGTAPSTFQAQARALQTTSVREPAKYTPNQTPSYKENGGYLIQIGAFGSAAEASRALQAIKTRVVPLLKEASPVTEPISKNGRTLYRARFAGFDSRRASSTCNQLRRQSVDCFVTAAAN